MALFVGMRVGFSIALLKREACKKNSALQPLPQHVTPNNYPVSLIFHFQFLVIFSIGCSSGRRPVDNVFCFVGGRFRDGPSVLSANSDLSETACNGI